MAKVIVQDGHNISLVAPYQRNPGEGALVGSIFGVALATTANGAAGAFAVDGVWDLAKATAQAWTQGVILYWDNAAKNVTTTASTNKLIGTAVQAQQTSDTVGRVRLNGAFIS